MRLQFPIAVMDSYRREQKPTHYTAEKDGEDNSRDAVLDQPRPIHKNESVFLDAIVTSHNDLL